MPFPTLTLPQSLEAATRQELEAFVSLLIGFLGVEHLDTGAHGAITASSVTVPGGGMVLVLDENGFATQFYRTAANGSRIDIQPTPTGQTPYLTLRYPWSTPVLEEVVQFGVVGKSTLIQGPGIRIWPGAPAGYYPWDVISGKSVAGDPAIVIADPTNNTKPLILVRTSGVYYLRPELGAALTLGENAIGKRITDAYILNGVHEQARSAVMGAWTAVAYSAGNFTASGSMTWGVDNADQAVFRYAIVGQTCFLNIVINTSDVAGTASTALRITLPSAFTVGAACNFHYFYNDAGAAAFSQGVGSATAGNSYIDLFKADLSNWTLTSGDNTSVSLNIALEVVG